MNFKEINRELDTVIEVICSLSPSCEQCPVYDTEKQNCKFVPIQNSIEEMSHI